MPRPLDHLTLLGDPGAVALLLRDRELDYRALEHRVAVLAGWLRRRLPGPGARVASWLAKGEAACLLPLAAARAGLVHVPINPTLKRGQVGHILADSGAALLIGNPGRLATFEPGDSAEAEPVDEASAWSEAEAAAVTLPPSNEAPDRLAAILYTSGSTGRPKGVMLSHANLWLGAVSVAHYLKLRSDDRVLAALPLSFDYGQNQLLSAWHAGGAVAPLEYLTARDVVKNVERHRITTLAAVPPLWAQLLDQAWPAGTAASLRRLTNSGGALTPELVRRLRDRFPRADLYPMYGLTEAFRSTFLAPDLVDSHPTSIGLAIPFAEIMVVADDGGEVQTGEEGELVHAGPLVAQGYWRDPARTAERFRPAPSFSREGGTAVWSGDRVRRDGQGLLYFVGRRDAMLKSSGHRISPEEIEEAAMATGLVAEAAAVGLADERLGQAIHLVVRAAPGVADETAAGLLPMLSRALPNFMLPRAVHWRERLPLSANGKLDRNALARELAATEGEA